MTRRSFTLARLFSAAILCAPAAFADNLTGQASVIDGDTPKFMGRGFVCGALMRRRVISCAGARIVYTFGAAQSPRMTGTHLSHAVSLNALSLTSLCATHWRLIDSNIAREITRAHR